MRAATIKEHPDFTLMKQTDIQSVYYMQMPRWLFSDPRYCGLSLEAKVAYTFLLNRFQLSRRKGWINENGEVFVIYPRKAMAEELRVCEQRVTAAIKSLAALKLIWEKRCGRGDANQIYLAKVEPIDDPDYSCAPFEDEGGSRDADSEALAGEEPQFPGFQSGENRGLRSSDFEVPEPQNPLPSKKDINKTKQSQKEVSQSTRDARDADADEEELTGILEACELSLFPEETARVFEDAIERLFYSDSLRLGNCTLPRCRVRSRLHSLNDLVLRDAEAKLAANREKNVKNATAYVMTTIFNCITEGVSDTMVDPYLNTLRGEERLCS